MIRLIIAVFTITGYCNLSCDKPPTHPAYAVMANGEYTHQGAIACPPKIPLGTEVYLPIGKFICEDRGGAIKGNRLDIWFPSCKEAREWGRKEMVGMVIHKDSLWGPLQGF